jgi:hypothetical protein
MMATGHHPSKTPTRIKVAFGSESGLFGEIPGEPRKIVELLFRA